MYQGKLRIIKSDLLDPPLGKEELHDKCCLICTDVATFPVTCTVCKSLFCLKCACTWKSDNNECPKKCQSPWNFTLNETLGLTLKCPFSQKCNKFIPEKITDHMESCQYAPENIKTQIKRRKEYLCDNGHLLEFWLAEYNTMAGITCSECSEKGICRSVCNKCDAKYCVICRPPPCSKKSCPNGHIFLKCSPQSYLCDNCGLAPILFDQEVYDDMICNFGLCQSCYGKLPESVQVKAFPNNYQNCRKNHPLVFLKNPREGRCDHCLKQANSLDRQCIWCQEAFCLTCKPIQVSFTKKCLHGHNFIQNEGKCRKCHNVLNGYKDTQCDLQLCTACAQTLQFANIGANRASIHRCPVQHQLYYNTGVQQTVCRGCSIERQCPLKCHICHLPFCQACKPSPFKDRDNFGHPYKINKKEQECRICLNVKECEAYCHLCQKWVCPQCLSK